MFSGSQMGFAFGNTATPVHTDTLCWLQREYSVAELLPLTDIAVGNVQGVQGVLRELFERALSAVSSELGRCKARYGNSLFSFSVEVVATAAELEQFATQCMDYAGAPWEGFTFKHRAQHALRVYGVHVDGVGSLVLRVWPSSLELTFCFEREVFFNDGYRDARPVHELPLSTWRSACCAMQLGQGGDVSLPTFIHGGRHYIISGISYVGAYAEGTAWTVCPLASWEGKTYDSTPALLRAYDSGEIERGDHRGQVVRVAGGLCVIDGAAVFVDRDAQFCSPATSALDEFFDDSIDDTADSLNTDNELSA